MSFITQVQYDMRCYKVCQHDKMLISCRPFEHAPQRSVSVKMFRLIMQIPTKLAFKGLSARTVQTLGIGVEQCCF